MATQPCLFAGHGGTVWDHALARWRCLVSGVRALSPSRVWRLVASEVIFSRDQAAQVRAGKITAAIVPASEQVTTGRLRALRRRFVRHDEDGNPVGEGVETVADVSADGDRRPVKLTILSVDEKHIDDLTQPDARACGYTTRQGLIDAWRAQHPRSEMVKLVRFALGDVRDIDRYIGWTGRAGGDYTMNRHRAADELRALDEQQLAEVTAIARRRDQERRKHPDQQLRDGLMRELERWELETKGVTDRDRAQAIRDIRRKIAALDRKLRDAA